MKELSKNMNYKKMNLHSKALVDEDGRNGK